MLRIVYVLVMWGVLISGHKVQLFAAEEVAARVVEFFPQRMLPIIKGAERVETFRINYTGEDEVNYYDVLSVGAVWDGEKAAQVAALLLSEKTYAWNSKKECKPKPGVLLKVWKGNAHVEVLLCFECDMATFIAKDAKGKVIARTSNEFDPARAQLVKWAKEALPEDTVIKGLKELRQ